MIRTSTKINLQGFKEKYIPEVVLSEIEMMTINSIANLRGIGSRLLGVKDGKVSDKNGSQIDFEGLLGEYAFCKIFNLFYEISPQPRSGSYDCIWNGKRTDIKSTTYQEGSLLGNINSNKDIDVYVLGIIEFRRSDVLIKFPGWLPSEELYYKSNLTYLNNNPVFQVRQSRLRTF